jgi:ribosomal protein S27AE
MRLGGGEHIVARYLARTCPRCGDYFGVVMAETGNGDVRVIARCAVCKFELLWRVLCGRDADESQ